MANRYLIGTGARNVSNTAIWSDTSGGTGGFSAPTSADAVWFDQNSGTGVLTLDGATSWGSLDSTGLTGIITITSEVYTLSLYGSWTIHGTYQKFALTGTAYFYQKGTGTITTNGNLFLALNRLYIDTVGGTVTNGDDFTTSAGIILKNGELNTNGKTIIIPSQFVTELGTKTLTLGSSIFNINSWSINVASGFTFNPNTSTVIVSDAIYSGGSTTPFYNLTIQGKSAITSQCNVFNNITISENLIIIGVDQISKRILIKSNTVGTPRTITCNGTTNITNCDFQDITLAGTANRDFSAQTDIGDCGGNSGITFPPAIDCYIKHTSGAMSVSNAAKWVTTDGGSTQARVPLPQDRAWGTANSFTGASTVTMDCPRIGSIDLSGVGQAVGWTLGNAISCYGNYVLGSNITQSGNVITTLSGKGNFNLNTYSKSIYFVQIISSASNYLNQSIINTLDAIDIQNGSFDVNDFNVSAVRLLIRNLSNVKLGNGIITLTNNVSNPITIGATATLSSEYSIIIINPLSGSSNLILDMGGKTFNNVHFSGTHTGNFDITGNNTFNNIKIDAGRKVRFTAGTKQNIASLDAVGTSASPITISSITAAEHTLNYTGSQWVQCDWLNLTNSKVLPVNRWFAGKNSVNGGGNTNWNFKRYIMTPIITLIR